MSKTNSNAETMLKEQLLDTIKNTADDLDELCEDLTNMMESGDFADMDQADILLMCADADYGIQMARACAYKACYSDMSEDDAAEVLVAAATLYMATEQLQAYLSSFLDDALDVSDAALEEQMSCMEDDGEDAELDFTELEEVARILVDAGLAQDGDEIILKITSGEDAEDEDGEDDDEEDISEEVGQVALQALEKAVDYLMEIGLMQEGQNLTIEVGPAEEFED